LGWGAALKPSSDRGNEYKPSMPMLGYPLTCHTKYVAGKAHQAGLFRGLEQMLKRSSGTESKLQDEKRCPFELWAARTI